MSNMIAYPGIGNLQIIAWFNDPANPGPDPIVKIINDFIVNRLKPEPSGTSADGYYSGADLLDPGIDGQSYSTWPLLKAAQPVPGAADGDVYFLSMWAPVHVKITWDKLLYHFGVLDSTTPQSVEISDVETWVFGGNYKYSDPLDPDWGGAIANFKVTWPVV